MIVVSLGRQGSVLSFVRMWGRLSAPQSGEDGIGAGQQSLQQDYCSLEVFLNQEMYCSATELLGEGLVEYSHVLVNSLYNEMTIAFGCSQDLSTPGILI